MAARHLLGIIITIMLARISLTLSRHFSLSFIASGRSSGLHPVSSHSCCMYFRAGCPAFARPYVGVHRSTSLMSSSLLLQQCPACLVRLAWIVFVMGGRWPYSCCMYFRAGCPAFARPYVGVHRSTSLMSSSLLLQQCPACLVRLAWIVFVMGGRWPYSCCMYFRAGCPAFARPYVGVHRSTSLMSSSLLLQQCPASLVRLAWIVFVMGGRWPYSWCLVGYCRQDLFNIARSILV